MRVADLRHDMLFDAGTSAGTAVVAHTAQAGVGAPGPPSADAHAADPLHGFPHIASSSTRTPS
ncbi:hypothetical protein D9V30_07140 [Mycetocola reblochoni]|uniref:Uncharacterized protein n=2 Tax=Mycetocola reblochoni TaxID=331618 RepID=A0A1R4IGR0_9MICO|nr:hypothetical protein D9V30_07140 [Mycetocola reblochoni]SJN19017.1 hypothetical protein FM119_01715 [Mycetocola reblochoni REB411]